MEPGTMRVEVPITYRCDRACKWCDRMIGVIPWEDSDITLADIRRAEKLVKKAGWKISMLKVTGGEPTLHPELEEICKLLKRWVMEDGIVRVSTNKTMGKYTRIEGTITRNAPDKVRRNKHEPYWLSPVDLGIEPCYHGYCHLAKWCGTVFDAYGFTGCHMAGPLGRVLHIDPYSPNPVRKQRQDICKHCIHSLKMEKLHELWKLARGGELEHPSKTFRRAFRREPMPLIRFSER